MGSRRNIGIVPIIGGALVVIVVSFFMSILPMMAQSTIDLRIGDGIFNARVATSDSDRTKGLGGVTKLDSNQALLMVFPAEDKWKIWMKDMKVPIDIVWLDSNKKVVYAVTNVLPNESTSEVFTPKYSAMYVVELPAGTIDSKAINDASIAIFNSENMIGIK